MVSKIRNIRFMKYDTFKHRALMILALIPIIIMIIVCNDIYYEIESINKQYESNVSELQYRKIQIIDYIIDERRKQMSIQNLYVSQFMMYNLSNIYSSDYDQLTKDVNSRSYTPALDVYNKVIIEDMELLKAAEVKYSGETLFICDNTGIITDTRYSAKPAMRDWKTIINTKSNPTLTQNTIDQLLNKQKTVLFWETSDNYSIIEADNGDDGVNSPDMNTINLIVTSYGLKGLASYNLLVPEYISPTDTSFNFTDSKVPNIIGNKIILVREINLYSIIEPYLSDIQNYDYVIKQYTENSRSAINNKIITCVIISGFLICSFLFCLLVISGYGDNITIRRGDNHDN